VILTIGTKGQAVVGLKEKLASQGFWPDGQYSASFTPKLAEAVAYFQQTHQDMYGRPLVVDGVVGMYTEWALKHPTGVAQKSGLGPRPSWRDRDIPRALSEQRRRILEVALGEYGVREKPMGSNRGPGIDKYLPKWWLNKPGKGPAWCCFFVSWVTKQVFGKYPLGRNHGSCKQAWRAAQERKMSWPKYRIVDTPVHKNPLHPMPGDAFYMQWGPRTGHIGFVYRVDERSEVINTIEGNCANRVKVGRRAIDERIMGYIDFEGDDSAALDHCHFERGLIEVADVGRDGTR